MHIAVYCATLKIMLSMSCGVLGRSPIHKNFCNVFSLSLFPTSLSASTALLKSMTLLSLPLGFYGFVILFALYVVLTNYTPSHILFTLNSFITFSYLYIYMCVCVYVYGQNYYIIRTLQHRYHSLKPTPCMNNGKSGSLT
jgi:hypothetical protein